MCQKFEKDSPKNATARVKTLFPFCGALGRPMSAGALVHELKLCIGTKIYAENFKAIG